ncbi:MAG TPA: class I SAM-dependent methyltransferase [Pirellulales bacterium]|nr:class I SAM-dependent methyltransferase [Pirellulales bacterium]
MSLFAAARSSYDRLAHNYDVRWGHYVDSSLDLITEALPLAAGDEILDVACGTGRLEERIVGRLPNTRVVGVDISENMLHVARSKRMPADYLAAEVSSLPFADGRFGTVVCSSAFHYFRRPTESLAEMRRVLRPGGYLVLVDWCDDYLACKICSVWLRWTDPAFFRTYSLRACTDLLRSAGFRVGASFRRRVDWLWGLMCCVGRA